ncbi:hypothetical protein [Staphylococcus chromogenes]
MRVNFIEMTEERSHPHPAIIDMIADDHHISVEGVSIGGGKVEIVGSNGFELAMRGNYPTPVSFTNMTRPTISRGGI